MWRGRGGPAVIEFFRGLGVVVRRGLAYQQNPRDRPPARKALLRTNLLSLAETLTAGKPRVLILQRVHL